jgi:RimJ/RimL family protein N-acetyltransferase
MRTSRLRLRPLTPDDVALVHSIYADPETMAAMPWRMLPTVRDAHGWVAQRLGEQGTTTPGTFLVTDDAGALVGICHYLPRGAELEIGWIVRKACWGRGYATEAVHAALTVAAARPVVAAIRPSNAASRRVADKVGLVADGEVEDEHGPLVLYRRPAVDVRDHGARGHGTHGDTAAVQRAVDDAAARGTSVRFPAGSYRCGSVLLRSGTRLVLAAGATLLASTDGDDFLPVEALPYPTHADAETSDFRHALLFGDDLSDVTITGAGTIDMQRDARFGPKPIALRRCMRVEVSGITIRRSPNYCVSLLGCDDVLVERVTIRDGFSDGIDPDSCRRVRVIGCDVESDDDALCLKSSLALGTPRACEDVVVRDCRLNSPSNGFKIGTETSGDVRRVHVRSCHVDGSPRAGADPAGLVLAEEGGGVAIESVDGAVVEDVHVQDVTVERCGAPVFVRLGARGRGQESPVTGAIRRVTITDLVARDVTDACTISGIPGHRIEDLVLDRVQVENTVAVPAPIDAVSEREADYPQAGMFGPLPASGVYARHVDGLALHDVTRTAAPGDDRPGIVTDDVV